MTPVYDHQGIAIYQGDSLAVLRELPEASLHCCVTSPPYWGLRDYGTAQWEGAADCDHFMPRKGGEGPASPINGGGSARDKSTGLQQYPTVCGKCGARRIDQQMGLEKTPEEYIARMVEVFREVRRMLRDDGTLWLNIGDSYTSGGRDYRDAGNSAYNGGNDGAYRGLQAKGSRPPVPHGLKPKDLVGIPWALAFALRADGWYLRSEIIWHKPNPMPESVTDRPTKSHEQIFLLAKSERYYYNAAAIQERASDDTHARYARAQSTYAPPGQPAHSGLLADRGNGVGYDMQQRVPAGWHQGTRPATPSGIRDKANGVNPKCAPAGSGIKQNESFSAAVKDVVEFRNKRTVWTIATAPFPEAHFATFPEDLVRPCILAGCPHGGTVLDPFSGAGTVALVARALNCASIGIELNPEYIEITKRRLSQQTLFAAVK